MSKLLLLRHLHLTIVCWAGYIQKLFRSFYLSRQFIKIGLEGLLHFRFGAEYLDLVPLRFHMRLARSYFWHLSRRILFLRPAHLVISWLVRLNANLRLTIHTHQIWYLVVFSLLNMDIDRLALGILIYSFGEAVHQLHLRSHALCLFSVWVFSQEVILLRNRAFFDILGGRPVSCVSYFGLAWVDCHWIIECIFWISLCFNGGFTLKISTLLLPFCTFSSLFHVVLYAE